MTIPPNDLVRGLIVDLDFLYPLLLDGKTWLLRPRPTDQRGRIALIAKGNKAVVAVATIVDCTRPLTREALAATQALHGITPKQQRLPQFERCRHAWVLADFKKLGRLVEYEHRQGWATWVRLDPGAIARVRRQLEI